MNTKDYDMTKLNANRILLGSKTTKFLPNENM